MKVRVLYEYMWVFPLIGGMFSLLALLTPAAFLSRSGNIFSLWMWGLVSVRVFDGSGFIRNTAFTDNIFIITPSVVFSILIGVCAIVLISSAISCKRDLKGVLGIKSSWLTPGILIIISTVGWIISIELVYRLGPSSMSFWEIIDPGFGVIGMFLGSGFAIGGYAISRYGTKQRDEVILITSQKGTLRSSPASDQFGLGFKFCPECNMKTRDELQRFCVNCGYKLD